MKGTELASHPDILEVIADLANDDLKTPPSVARQMLDLLPSEVFDDPHLRWLDPACKSGIFLREVARRLLKSEGMKAAFPDERERLEHIFNNMLFGVATTQINALISRRTLYLSKNAAGHASAATLSTEAGNIWWHRVSHTWGDRTCKECGGVRKPLDVPGENKAYAFIHENGRNRLNKELDMKFDVILGNPPYQMSDGGSGGSAQPIYQDFIHYALELNPRYLLMVVPSRWFAGGRGLGDFRAKMLEDGRTRKIVDYQDARTVFPDINLNGGVNYFLWDRDHTGPCEVTSIHYSGRSSSTTRDLNTYDVFIRLNEAVPIVEKIRAKGDKTFDTRVSPLKPFGFRTFYEGRAGKAPKGGVTLYGTRGSVTWVRRSEVEVNAEWIDQWKVLIPRGTDGNENYPLPVLTEPIIAGPGTACTETYLVIGPVGSQQEAENLAAYMKTRFFRFLLSLRKHTQDNSREKFAFIPDLSLSKVWTDELLNKRYGITEDEQAFIAEQIREMA